MYSAVDFAVDAGGKCWRRSSNVRLSAMDRDLAAKTCSKDSRDSVASVWG